MSVFETHKEALETHEFMLGTCRGRLAVSLDILTDCLTSVGMHGVYCHSARHPGRPKLDIEQVMKNIEDTKELIITVMTELKKLKNAENITASTDDSPASS